MFIKTEPYISNKAVMMMMMIQYVLIIVNLTCM